MSLPLDPPKHYDTEDRAAPEDEPVRATASPPQPPATEAEDAQEAGSSDDESPAASEEEPTKEELYERAQELEVEGRSSMDKGELKDAVEESDGKKSRGKKSRS